MAMIWQEIWNGIESAIPFVGAVQGTETAAGVPQGATPLGAGVQVAAQNVPTAVTAATPFGAASVLAIRQGAASLQQTAPAPAPSSSGSYTMRWLLAWSVAAVLFFVAIRTRFGYNTAYYLVALMLLLLLVTQYRWLAAALAPITGQPVPAPAAS